MSIGEIADAGTAAKMSQPSQGQVAPKERFTPWLLSAGTESAHFNEAGINPQVESIEDSPSESTEAAISKLRPSRFSDAASTRQVIAFQESR